MSYIHISSNPESHLKIKSFTSSTRGEKACTCPTPRDSDGLRPVMLAVNGYLFDPGCPFHRHAVMAEVQRQFGRPQ